MHITQPQTVVQNISIRGAAQLINYDSIVGLIFIFVAFVNLAEIVISKKKQLSNYTNNVFLRTTNLCLQVPKQSREMVQTLMIGLNCQKLHVKSFVHVCVCVFVCVCVCMCLWCMCVCV